MIIISSFIEKANITRKLGFIKLKSDYDFREFDLVLDEVCIISQKVWYFERFIKMRVGKMLEGVDVLPSFLSFVEDIRFTKGMFVFLNSLALALALATCNSNLR